MMAKCWAALWYKLTCECGFTHSLYEVGYLSFNWFGLTNAVLWIKCPCCGKRYRGVERVGLIGRTINKIKRIFGIRIRISFSVPKSTIIYTAGYGEGDCPDAMLKAAETQTLPSGIHTDKV